MKNTKKRGFTIVELVIVIAVIAILAAILIPTFSNIIKKANLSADKQAVREMNMALAEWAASSGYAMPEDDTEANDAMMQALANAGYNTVNWQCLTEGYQVFWYKNDNCMILYNTETASIEYPEEYVGTKTMIDASHGFFLYNYNHVEAQNKDLGGIASSATSNNLSKSSSLSGAASFTKIESGLNSVQASNITKIDSAITSNTAISSALSNGSANKGTGSALYFYGTNENVSSATAGAFASLQVAAVGTEENPATLISNGKLQENLYFISVVNNGGTESELKAAKKAAGEYVYTIFDQMTTGKITTEAVIVLDAGTEIDCSACEWAPCKTFTGYFGTTDATKPVVVNGARLTSQTGHAMTVAFNGSGSKYFVTGFFGTVYGNATIENVTFKGIKIETPAIDYEITESDKGAKLINTRNTVGIIGGITDNYSMSNPTGTAVNVTLKNIIVEDTCAITGAGCCGGLVGYIGSTKEKDLTLAGNIVIDNCAVHCDVTSTDNHSTAGYKSVGGIIGFTCRVSTALTIAVNNCTFDGKLSGYGSIGAVAGAFQNNRNVTINGGSYDKCTLDAKKTASTVNSIAGYCENPNTIVVTGSPALVSGINASSSSNGKTVYNIGSDGKLAK